MKLGCAFHHSILSDITDTTFIEMLEQNGVSHIESHIELTLDDIKYISKFVKKGYSVSLHLPLDLFATWVEDRKRANEMLDHLITSLPKEIKINPILVLHPATQVIGDGEIPSRQDLFSSSVDYIKFVNDVVNKHFDGYIIALENLTHGRSKVRIGDNIEDLVELRRSIRIDNLKFCWDIGHHIMSQRFREEQKIPDEFLDNLALVHLHGVEGKDRAKEQWWDHYHLNSNSIPWEKYMRLLQDHAFDGPIVMEVFVGLRQSTKITLEDLKSSIIELKQQIKYNSEGDVPKTYL